MDSIDVHGSTCVRTLSIFKGLDDEEIAFLERVTLPGYIHKGKIIFLEGDIAKVLYIVERGLIKLSKLTKEGKEQIIRLVFPGDIFGHSVLLQNGHYYASAEALQDSIICTIKQQDFEEVMGISPKLSARLIIMLYERLHNADEWIYSLSLLEVEQRLARVILLFHEKFQIQNGRFTLPVPQKELAPLIGTTPETLSRKFKGLGSKKIIQMKDHNDIRILNYIKLKELAGL